MNGTIPKLIIIRGLSGSGKTELAALIKKGNPSETSVLSMDNYRISAEGEYRFNPDEIPLVVKKLDDELESLMRQEKLFIVLDGTHHLKAHIDKYKFFAEKYHYCVQIIEIAHEDPEILAARNVHGVTRTVIEKMILRWEDAGYRMNIRKIFYKLKKRLQFWKPKHRIY